MRKKKITTGFEDINLMNPKEKERLYSTIPMDSRCPRQLKCLSGEPCPYALNTIYQQGPPHEQCEWYIVHGDSNYCFFTYQHLHNKVHTLDEIATLTNSTITSADLYIKRSLMKLHRKMKSKHDFTQYLDFDTNDE